MRSVDSQVSESRPGAPDRFRMVRLGPPALQAHSWTQPCLIIQSSISQGRLEWWLESQIYSTVLAKRLDGGAANHHFRHFMEM